MNAKPTLAELTSLHGQTALITGAATGIGRAIAERLAEAGASLTLLDINLKNLNETTNKMRDLGYSATAHEINLQDKAAIDAFWKSTKPIPDILINNAGIYPSKDFLATSEEDLETVMDINIKAVYWMCQEFIRQRKKLGGVIVNIASIEAILPFKEDLVSYSVSKAGVIALTRALAKEYAKDGFRINVLLPGGIVTSGTKAVASQIFKGNIGLIKTAYDFGQRLPAKRLGQADEVARMVLVLTTELASYVHGAVIAVDGGFLAS